MLSVFSVKRMDLVAYVRVHGPLTLADLARRQGQAFERRWVGYPATQHSDARRMLKLLEFVNDFNSGVSGDAGGQEAGLGEVEGGGEKHGIWVLLKILTIVAIGKNNLLI